MGDSDDESIISSVYWQLLASQFDLQSSPPSSSLVNINHTDSPRSEQPNIISENIQDPTPPSNQHLAYNLAKIHRKRKFREPTSWVWGPKDNLNGKVVIIENIEYWQCVRCPQHYQRVYSTSHSANHLNKTQGIFQLDSRKSKRLIQAQRTIEQTLKHANKMKTKKDEDRERKVEEDKYNYQIEFQKLDSSVLESFLVSIISI